MCMAFGRIGAPLDTVKAFLLVAFLFGTLNCLLFFLGLLSNHLLLGLGGDSVVGKSHVHSMIVRIGLYHRILERLLRVVLNTASW